MNSPAYFRARLAFIDHLIQTVPDDGTKNNDSTVLKSGTIPVNLLNGKTEQEAVLQFKNQGNYANDPLTFAELTTWNTWFAMHPEKVAGVEKVTTSIQFPITIIGTQQDIENTINHTLSQNLQPTAKYVDVEKNNDPKFSYPYTDFFERNRSRNHGAIIRDYVNHVSNAIKAGRKLDEQTQKDYDRYSNTVKNMEDTIPIPQPKAKQPWEMTKSDFKKSVAVYMYKNTYGTNYQEYFVGLKRNENYIEYLDEYKKLKDTSYPDRSPNHYRKEDSIRERLKAKSIYTGNSNGKRFLKIEQIKEIAYSYIIRAALEEGKPVPQEVINDYPELKITKEQQWIIFNFKTKEDAKQFHKTALKEIGGVNFSIEQLGYHADFGRQDKYFSTKENIKILEDIYDATQNQNVNTQNQQSDIELMEMEALALEIELELMEIDTLGQIGKKDRNDNFIGDGNWHVSYDIIDFSEYPQITSNVNKSLSTETVYVTYRNKQNDKSIKLRFSSHINNAVKFGDQLDGNLATKNEVLYHLGLKERVFIPSTHLSIATRQVARKKLKDFKEGDKTIQELYAMGANADISEYKGKLAKDSNYLILDDKIDEYPDTRLDMFGNTVRIGKYVYVDKTN